MDALKKIRKEGYGDKKEEESSSPRLIKLTDDEAKSLGEYGGGEEAECLVRGRLEGNSLTVMSVSPAQDDSEEKEMAGQMMGPMGGVPLGQ